MNHLHRLSFVLVVAALLLSGCRPIQAPAAEPPAASTPVAAPTTPPPATPAAVPTQTAPLVPVPGNMEEQSGEITSQALAGNLLGDDATRDFNVLLPPNYNAGTARYPVVYILPGFDGGPYNDLYDVQAAMEKLLHDGEAREMILVFPDIGNKLGASLVGNSPTIGDYETYLTKELVDTIDAQYRTLPTRDSRGVAGCDNGGEAAMRVALKYPDVFGATGGRRRHLRRVARTEQDAHAERGGTGGYPRRAIGHQQVGHA